jgi:hypothetical protein
MFETQLAQLATAVPSAETGKIPGQPKPTLENINAVTTKWGKPSRGHFSLTMQKSSHAQEETHGVN